MKVSNQQAAFGAGVAAGVAAAALVNSGALRKAAVAAVGTGMRIKDSARSFADSVIDGVQGIFDEARENNRRRAEESRR